MAGRGSRRRATVNYSVVELEKGTATPTWLNSKSRRATIASDFDSRQSGAAEPAAKVGKAKARQIREDVGVAKPGKQRKASKQSGDAFRHSPAPAKHAARNSVEGTLAQKPAGKESKHSKVTRVAVTDPVKVVKARVPPPPPPPDPAASPSSSKPSRNSAPSPAAAAAAEAASRKQTSKKMSGSKRAAKDVSGEDSQAASKRHCSGPKSDATTRSEIPPAEAPSASAPAASSRGRGKVAAAATASAADGSAAGGSRGRSNTGGGGKAGTPTSTATAAAAGNETALVAVPAQLDAPDDVAAPPQPSVAAEELLQMRAAHRADMGRLEAQLRAVEASAAAHRENYIEQKRVKEEILGKYTQLKERKLKELDDLLHEQANDVESHLDAATEYRAKLEAYAREQAAIVENSSATETVAELASLRRKVAQLQVAAAEHELALALRDSKSSEQGLKLAQAEAKLAQAEAKLAQDRRAYARAAEAAAFEEAATAATAALPAEAAAAAAQPSGSAADQSQSAACASRAEVAAAPAQPRMNEARAMAPEGHSLSESGQPPAHQQADTNAGLVYMRTADKPLVPYRLGLSRGGGADTPAAAAAPAAAGSPSAGGGDEATVDCGGGGGAAAGVATPASARSLPIRELDFAAHMQSEYGTPGREAAMQPPAPRPPFRLAAPGLVQPPVLAAAAVSAMSTESGGGLGSGLQTLLGMEATPMKHGGYLFTHQQSGYAFRIGKAAPGEESEEAAPELGEEQLMYYPLNLGTAAEALPAYLRGDMVFGAARRGKLVLRIMEALDKFTQAASFTTGSGSGGGV